jgi:4-hydroxybenzoate polyprenyltransferase
MNVNLYVKVFRIDHWMKNVFTIIGSFGAIFIYRPTISGTLIFNVICAFILSCCISSVNYVINEILDASFDALHPTKKNRPIPSGQITLYKLIVSAFILLAVTFVVSDMFFDKYFNLSLLSLFIAGLIYNIRPVRAKDLPFIDVVSESINNPIRLFIGWYALQINMMIPPVSIIFFFWTLGGFLMTAKRVAEFRLLGKQGEVYRPTFKYYTVKNLTVALFLYAGFSIGFFIYFAYIHKFVLLLSVPFYVGFVFWYSKLTYKKETVVMDPEHIYKYPWLVSYIIFCCLFTFISLVLYG